MLLLCGVFPGTGRAAALQLNDGSTLEGEIVLPANSEGLNVRIAENQYRRVPWTSFSQPALQELVKNPKLAPFAEPYLEVPEEVKIQRTEGVIKPVPRLDRPASSSLLGAFFNSSVGLIALLLIYAANIYAGYEIAFCRAQPIAMACGAGALLPVIGPLIFLCLPARLLQQRVRSDRSERIVERAPADGDAPVPARPALGGLRRAPAPSATAATPAPQAQVFQRGQFMFNRRFFETQFPDFFGVIRRDSEKDRVLVIKTPRGLFTAIRITRIAANDLHLEIRKGSATQEVMLPFAEIQEVVLKPGSA